MCPTVTDSTHKEGAYTEEIHAFTLDFFRFFGAKVKKLSRKKMPALNVTLSPDLAESLGYASLHLVFTPDELSKIVSQQRASGAGDSAADNKAADNQPVTEDKPSVVTSGVELVAHGSRIFDRMVAHLEKRSALTLQRLPSKFVGGEELMAAVRPINTSIAKLNMQEQLLNLYIYNWHVAYRADDKYEEILTVAIDDGGTLYPLMGTVGETAKEAETEQTHLDDLLADGEPIEPTLDEEGLVKPVPLPPMTELTRLAESARKYAIYHADVRCVAHEVDVQQRLYRVLNRLNSYYTQQINEVYDSHDASGEKRSALEQDLHRKINEEVENHRLRVQVRLFSYAIMQVPIAVADLTLTDGKQETLVRVRRNQYNGAIQRPACHACDTETRDIVIDRNSHVTCNDCVRQCDTCQDTLCASCGVEPCSVCEKENCDTCGKECWACGERACIDHIGECPICRDTVCHTCQTKCAECGVQQCRSHLRVDSVIASTDQESALICASCAVRCLGCAQYSVRIDTCEKSGQRFCVDCLENCSDCQRRIGPDYYIVNPGDKEIYCRDCATVCPACHSPVAELSACQECETDCCVKCSAACEQCQAIVCQDHTARVDACGHFFCTAHSQTCVIGGELVCPLCEAVCGICQSPHCTHHTESCGLCRCTYCSECMDKNLDLCSMCATIRTDGKIVQLANDPLAKHPDVQPLVDHYRWTMAENLHYTIYLGEGPLNTGALILVQNSANGPLPRAGIKDSRTIQTDETNSQYIVDEILKNLSAGGERLRNALQDSGLIDGDEPEHQPQKHQPQKHQSQKREPKIDSPSDSAEAGAQVLVVRKINALDLLWRRG